MALRVTACLFLSLLLAACNGGGSQDQAQKSGQNQAEQAAPAPAEAQPQSEVAAPESGVKADIEAALAGDHRSDEHKARDQYRHPVETLTFFGLEPDMTVVELWPGAGGWYTEVLAPVLRDNGQLIEASYPSDTDSDYYNSSADKYEKKLAANPEVYDKVKVVPFMPPERADLGEPGSADMVLTFRNLHNWQQSGALPSVFKAAFRVLKPGGVFGVVEHRAPKGTTIDAVEDTGYMPESYVKALAQEIGFKLAAESEVNANPKDTGDHPAGVWTLPPTLRYCNEMQEGAAKAGCYEKYRDIGESDRMTLKFVKPATE